jgi:catechol 2,3-dioxygenase-like lactoylglutathione lyase family enzyme
MIRDLVHTALLVRDYDAAKHFYCDTLGFEVVEDTLYPDGKRWVRIRAAGGGGSEILLSRAITAEQDAVVGKQAGGRVLFYVHTDDFSADCSRLRNAGVEFVEEPRHENYGKVAVLKDLYGNRIDFIQPRVPSPRAVLSEWVRLINAHEPGLLAELYAAGATNLQVANGTPLVGKEAIREDFTKFFSNIPDSYTKIENLFEDGEWAILEWSGGGTFRPTGKTFSLRGCGFFKVYSGKIVFQRGYWDKATWFGQVGLPSEG